MTHLGYGSIATLIVTVISVFSSTEAADWRSDLLYTKYVAKVFVDYIPLRQKEG